MMISAIKPRLFITFWVIFFSISCQTYNPFGPEKKESMTIHTTLAGVNRAAVCHVLTRMELMISAANMDTLLKEMNMDQTGASVSVQVPAGKNRTFTVNGWVNSVKLLSGSTTLDLNPGEDQQVNIVLRFISPALIITPPDTSVHSSAELRLRISTRHIERLATAGIRLEYNSEILQLESMAPCMDFLSHNGGQVAILHQKLDNKNGIAECFFSILPASKAVEGNGDLIELKFRTLRNDSTTVTIIADHSVEANLGLFGQDAKPITVVSLNGTVRVQ